jgi:YVTN family beta-propeller protein
MINKNMKNHFFVGALLMIGLVIFVQCSDDPDPVVESFFNNGVFIVNEGNFMDSDGSLSFYDFDSSKVRNNIFEAINDRPLAAVTQSLKFYNDRGYIIDSNGRVEIVEKKDLTSVGSITNGLSLPRFFVGHSTFGYVTDWGPYDDNWGNPDSRILVIDLALDQITRELETPSRPEGIVAVNDKIYVANSGTDLVTIYDPATNSLTDSIKVNNGPTHFAIDKNQDLWVISTGAYITGGALQKINPTTSEVIHTVDISNTLSNGKLSINGTGELLFFMGEQWAPDYSYTENKVYKTSISQPESYSEIISERNLFGLGVDPVNNQVYVTDAVAFQGNGKVYVYDFSGNKQEEYSVGRGPNGFVFMTQPCSCSN